MSSILNRFKPLFMSVIVLAGLSQRVMAGDDGGIAAVPAGSEFSFQGKLNQGGQAFTGQAEFAFTLYDAPAGGVLIATASPAMQTVAVTSGLFTTTIDFGAPAFVSQSARWVSMSVRTPPGNGAFVTLSPRQRVTPAPVAMYALSGAGLTLPYLASQSSPLPDLISVTNTFEAGGGYSGRLGGFNYGVVGKHNSTGNMGFIGHTGYGVLAIGESPTSSAVRGHHEISGNDGELGTADYGVYGRAVATTEVAVFGENASTGNYGQLGTSDVGAQGVAATSTGSGVFGQHVPSGNIGRLATNDVGVSGVAATATSTGVYAEHVPSGHWARLATAAYSGYFNGNVKVDGNTFFNHYLHLDGEGMRVDGNGGKTLPALIVTNGGEDGSVAIHASCSGGPNAAAVRAYTSQGVGVFASCIGAGYAAKFEGNVLVTPTSSLGLGVAPLFQLQLSTNDAAKPTSNTWTIFSDRRLKKNITPLHGSLDQLMQLKGVTYQWIDPTKQGDMRGTYTGMIAQDVERVFPEWVNTGPDGYKTLTVIGFEGLVVEALRDLRLEKDEEIADLDEQLKNKNAQIEHLYAAHAALHSRMEAMERAIQTLSQKH